MMDINIVGRMTGKLEKETPLLAASLILPQNQLEKKQREKVLPTLSCQYFSTQRETAFHQPLYWTNSDENKFKMKEKYKHTYNVATKIL